MDQISPDADDIASDLKLRDLESTIQLAEIRCMSTQEIIERLLKLPSGIETADYVKRLGERELDGCDHALLVEAIRELGQQGEAVASKLKARIDRTILRLIRLLPADLAVPLAEPFLFHPRKARRQWAYSALRRKPVPESLACQLMGLFERTGDQESLELIACNPDCVVAVDAKSLLEQLGQQYWRARVLETLLLKDRERGISLGAEFPTEFAHAVGRTRDRSLLESLRRLLIDNLENLNFLSLYAYALGKLRAKSELQELNEILASRRPAT